ncbi:hypothetical protein ACFLTG_00560 [Chloroflexota bacterium]
MRLTMNDGQLRTVEQVRQFLKGSEEVEFRGLTAKEKYYWIEEVLIRFRYHRLKRAVEGVIRLSPEVHPIKSLVIGQNRWRRQTNSVSNITSYWMNSCLF